MSSTISSVSPSRHRLLSDVRPTAAKADIRKADQDWRSAVGRVVRQVRGPLSLKEFAAAIARDERQVARWEDGTERPHVDAIFAVEEFRQPLVIGLASLPETGIEIVTTLTAAKKRA